MSSSATVIITTYRQPETLAFVLAALARQSVPPGEVVVADDGSGAATAAMLAAEAAGRPFRLVYVRQPDDGFRAARSRNNGIHAARGSVLAFLDQDTLPHRGWLASHLAAVGPGRVSLGHVMGLSEAAASGLTRAAVDAGAFETMHAAAEWAQLGRVHRRYAVYALLRRAGIGIKTKPKLASGNFAACREDLRRVNGFDEEYRGWGQEDDDLGRRLYGAGVRPRVRVCQAVVTHLPHPLRRPEAWKGGANAARFAAGRVAIRCGHGLDAHPHRDVQMNVLQA